MNKSVGDDRNVRIFLMFLYVEHFDQSTEISMVNVHNYVLNVSFGKSSVKKFHCPPVIPPINKFKKNLF